MILTYAYSSIIEKMLPLSKQWGLQFLDLDGAMDEKLERAQNRMLNCISSCQCPLCAQTIIIFLCNLQYSEVLTPADPTQARNCKKDSKNPRGSTIASQLYHSSDGLAFFPPLMSISFTMCFDVDFDISTTLCEYA